MMQHEFSKNPDPIAQLQPWQDALSEVRKQARILLPDANDEKEVNKIFDVLLGLHMHLVYLYMNKPVEERAMWSRELE